MSGLDAGTTLNALSAPQLVWSHSKHIFMGSFFLAQIKFAHYFLCQVFGFLVFPTSVQSYSCFEQSFSWQVIQQEVIQNVLDVWHLLNKFRIFWAWTLCIFYWKFFFFKFMYFFFLVDFVQCWCWSEILWSWASIPWPNRWPGYHWFCSGHQKVQRCCEMCHNHSWRGSSGR